MQKILLLLFCLSAQYAAGAQSSKFSFQLGPAYQLPGGTEDLTYLGSAQQGIVDLVKNDEMLYLLQFDPVTLQKKGQRTLKLGATDRNLNLERCLTLANGKTYLFYSDYNKDSHQEVMLYSELDVPNAKFAQRNVSLLRLTHGLAGDYVPAGYFKAKIVNKYVVTQSFDSTKLLVKYVNTRQYAKDTKNVDVMGFCVYDANLKQLWAKEFTMPYVEAKFTVEQTIVDNNANAYMLCKVYETTRDHERNRETDLPNYHYEIFKFQGNKDTPEIITVDVRGKFMRDIAMLQNDTARLILASTYSNKAKGSSVDGVFINMVNPNGGVSALKNGMYEFPVSELRKYVTGRAARKMDKSDDYEVPNMQVRDVRLEVDGSLLITAEEYNSEMVTVNSGKNTYSYIKYTYGSILATKIAPNGSLEWIRKIPKSQTGTNGAGTLSYSLSEDNAGSFYFMFLDNKKNEDLKEDESPYTHQNGLGGQVAVVKLDSKGNMTKEIVFDVRDQEIMISPRQFQKFDESHFIGRASMRGDKYAPLLITVKQ